MCWKDELVTNRPEIVNGAMTVPTGPGWGTDLNEDVADPWGSVSASLLGSFPQRRNPGPFVAWPFIRGLRCNNG